jgi:hypothetical protein
MRLGVGDPLRGLNVQLFSGPGYDRQSGLAPTGADTDTYVQDAMGPFTLSAFRYDGLRPIPGAPYAPDDRFTRDGFGFTYGQWTRFSSEAVLIEGNDSNCVTPRYEACVSSGGFEQLRYAFNRRLFAEARYEGTNTPGVGIERDGMLLLGYGPTENTRVTLEDVDAHGADAASALNLQFTIAY